MSPNPEYAVSCKLQGSRNPSDIQHQLPNNMDGCLCLDDGYSRRCEGDIGDFVSGVLGCWPCELLISANFPLDNLF